MANPSPFDGDETLDTELVRLVQQGDQGALEALVERHRPWIYNIALRMVYLPQDAEEASQEMPATDGNPEESVTG